MKFNFLFIWLFIRKLVYSWHETIFRDMRVRIGAEGGRVPNSVLTEPLKSVLDKLQLLSSDGQPNNAAAMLFTKDEKGYYPQFTIQMARFRGTDKNEFIDNQRAYGNFFDLLDSGIAFLLIG
ncbi:hypothetical protein [Segatella bryantii]|uniref:hypothetical protein n=1 Tax=Segatella bryantii TaxID=77095 RepID=UPI0008904B80|nr:hypothetical protein [Segatella bryantii]SDL95149.1 ATP-dependent DNA helicase RecG [Segatella bryantii]